MPYIPSSHEKYNLLPYCREHGGEVFEYPGNLLNKINALLDADEHLDPYGYSSYEEYNSQIDHVAQRFCDQPDVRQLLQQYKEKIREMNQKEQWSVLRYLGPADNRLFSLTPGRCYYWPSSYTNPVYSGVVDDEEYTSYFHPVDQDFWEIIEDPTGMAYNTIYGISKTKYSKIVHDHIMKQIQHSITDI